MGFLEVGEPYSWEDSREVIEYIREHGVEQFLAMWGKVADIDHDELKWGDEIEYGIFVLNPAAGTVRCSLRGAEILKELQERELPAKQPSDSPLAAQRTSSEVGGCQWVPEYGSWMVEATPDRPYSCYAQDLVNVERNMRLRRARLLSALRPNEVAPTVPCFPLLGVGNFTEPPTKYAAHRWARTRAARCPPPRVARAARCACHAPSPPPPACAARRRCAPACCDRPNGPIARSLFIPDAVINPHPRFGALTANIRERRGSNVDIRMPKFVDTHTTPFARPVGCPAPASVEEADSMAEVYMDAMAFGMGCCCLQVRLPPSHPSHPATLPSVWAAAACRSPS
jgi:glutamate--cysteine ligase catalytic subunit